MRNFAYGEGRRLSFADKVGSWLSRRKLVARVRKRKPAAIVDIGCGYRAELLQALAPYARTCTGIDIRTDKTVPGIRMIDAVLDKSLPMLADGECDFMVMHNVLEHLQHPLEILMEARRALRDGGELFINVPSWPGKRFLEFSAFRLHFSAILEIDDHKMYYNPRDLWPLLVKAGFRPRHLELGFHKFGLNTYCYARKGAVWDRAD